MKSFKQMVQAGEIKRADAMKVRLDDIHEEPGFNLRTEGEDLQASIESLADYILTGGMYPALEVRPRADGGVFVVDGHRRRRSLRLARDRGAPIEWVNVVAFTGNDADRVARIMTSAEGRALSPLEIAQGYKRLQGFGLGVEEIAAKVGKTRQHVDQLLILANANSDVQRLVATGGVSAALAVKVARDHGEDAGEVLQQELTKAKAAGKKKVTAGTMKPWTPSGPDALALMEAVEDLFDNMDPEDHLKAQRGEQFHNVPASAPTMKRILAAFSALDDARDKAAQRAREKAAREAQVVADV